MDVVSDGELYTALQAGFPTERIHFHGNNKTPFELEMALDANILIFERIREELAAGTPPQTAITAGYDKAFSSIADANVTTLIAGIVLFAFGTGPIKGFAVTLSLGIVTSMFTAIVGTRSIVNLVYGRRKVETVPVG